jgi:cell shape-determining protein MreC
MTGAERQRRYLARLLRDSASKPMKPDTANVVVDAARLQAENAALKAQIAALMAPKSENQRLQAANQKLRQEIAARNDGHAKWISAGS